MRGKDSPTAPRALRREATRASLLEAAVALSAQGAPDPLDPAAIAERAGVSRPLFYRYYRSRGEFADALLGWLHGEARPAEAPSAGATVADRLRAFFLRLAAPLEARADLARTLIPRTLLPGPVAEARARRRQAAIERIEGLLPLALDARRARAAFLMDAFIGLQVAWSRETNGEPLLARVRRDMTWAIAGALAPPEDDARAGLPSGPAGDARPNE